MRDQPENASPSGDDDTLDPIEAAAAPRTGARGALEFLRKATRDVRQRQLERLHDSRSAVVGKLRDIPDRMQRLTNQVRLLLDLVDDYWSGRYRKVRWYSLGIAVAAALYFVSPSDLIPDALPGVGHLDDMLVIAIALRLVRQDLLAYVEFRELDPADYFAPVG